METFSLNFQQLDPEAKWGITGKKYTAVNNLWSLMHGILYTAIFYGAPWPLHNLQRYPYVDMFFHGGQVNRSSIPYYTMLLTFWCLAILAIKWRKLAVQKKALEIQLIPEDNNFVISKRNAEKIISEMHSRVYQSDCFMVLWRLECALANLHNIGRVADVSSVFADLAENDSNFIQSSYTLVKGLIWAIPVTGFIGTVLGLSQAVGGFGAVVASGADLETLKGALSGVTGGLAVAFETTLIALVAALVVQLLMTLLMQKEEEFLDDCSAYCHNNVISKLRMIEISEQWNDEQARS